ncbi:LuxR C-terminal-related transcriptional regulator [Polycladidibacter hongkongensis]|uniref:LuxR C-terminal-related transcriptional regulator n=1 Tax=Polycladidibacter hongkongensis TaxID=1647556 RepID=UPI00082F85A9|nr:LuxR C-terminal-related transcriptional regulator [Pseudovibrio hongkongensis]
MTADTLLEQINSGSLEAPANYLVEQLDSGVIILTRSFEILLVNTSAKQHLNRVPSINIAGKILEVCDCEQLRPVSEAIRARLELTSLPRRAPFELKKPELDIDFLLEVISLSSEPPLVALKIIDPVDLTKRRLTRAELIYDLTRREAEVLRQLCSSLTEPQIAVVLNISANTLRTHRKNIYAKLHVNNRNEMLLLLSRLA